MLNALIAIMGDTFDRVQQSKVATAIYRCDLQRSAHGSRRTAKGQQSSPPLALLLLCIASSMWANTAHNITVWRCGC